MLLGFSLDTERNGYRLFFTRSELGRNVLVWVLLVAENYDALSHHSFLNFNIHREAGGLVLSTRASKALRPAFEKWYPEGRRKFPDVVLTYEMAVFWLVSALSRKGPVYLEFVGMTASQTVRMAVQFKRITGLWCMAGRSGMGNGITLDRADAERWLAQRVPVRVWSIRP